MCANTQLKFIHLKNDIPIPGCKPAQLSGGRGAKKKDLLTQNNKHIYNSLWKEESF